MPRFALVCHINLCYVAFSQVLLNGCDLNLKQTDKMAEYNSKIEAFRSYFSLLKYILTIECHSLMAINFLSG